MVMQITLLRLPFVLSTFAVAAEALWLRLVMAGSFGAVGEHDRLRASLSFGNRGGNAKPT